MDKGELSILTQTLNLNKVDRILLCTNCQSLLTLRALVGSRDWQAYADMSDMLELTEGLIVRCAEEVLGGLDVQYQGQSIDFTPPFRRASMASLVQEATGTDFKQFQSTELEQAKAAAVECVSMPYDSLLCLEVEILELNRKGVGIT